MSDHRFQGAGGLENAWLDVHHSGCSWGVLGLVGSYTSVSCSPDSVFVNSREKKQTVCFCCTALSLLCCDQYICEHPHKEGAERKYCLLLVAAAGS